MTRLALATVLVLSATVAEKLSLPPTATVPSRMKPISLLPIGWNDSELGKNICQGENDKI
jgi:hypothetical protein